VQTLGAELPQPEAAVGDEEVWRVRRAALNREDVILQQERIAATSTMGSKQKLLGAQVNRCPVPRLARAQGFFLSPELLKVEAARGSPTEPVGALQRVMPEQEEFRHHGLTF
jgi:hypothetical protein